VSYPGVWSFMLRTLRFRQSGSVNLGVVCCPNLSRVASNSSSCVNSRKYLSAQHCLNLNSFQFNLPLYWASIRYIYCKIKDRRCEWTQDKERGVRGVLVRQERRVRKPTLVILSDKVNICWGRAIAQTVSRRLPTATALVRTQVRSCGICGGQSDTGVGFLRILRFPCQFLSHRLLHTHQLSSVAGTSGQLVADVPSGLSLTPPQGKRNISCRRVIHR
jgi:hypothetical protein